jgi:hypothetical protein
MSDFFPPFGDAQPEIEPIQPPGNKAGAQHNLRVDLDEATAQGLYSNLLISNFSQEEFVLDFAFLQPQMDKTKVKSRVVVSPRNMKRFVRLLTNQLAEYEAKYGAILDGEGDSIRMSFN